MPQLWPYQTDGIFSHPIHVNAKDMIDFAVDILLNGVKLL
jgi:hypothetical protein